MWELTGLPWTFPISWMYILRSYDLDLTRNFSWNASSVVEAGLVSYEAKTSYQGFQSQGRRVVHTWAIGLLRQSREAGKVQRPNQRLQYPL